MKAVTTDEGETVYVAADETERGSRGSFYTVYQSEDREDRYGYQCGSCGALDVAVDTMGRIVCNRCGNTRKPEEWDAAHE